MKIMNKTITKTRQRHPDRNISRPMDSYGSSSMVREANSRRRPYWTMGLLAPEYVHWVPRRERSRFTPLNAKQ